jgi:hypothetical protein
MLALDSPRWAELCTAYGAAGDIPKLLRRLAKVPNSADYRDEPWFSIWSALAHQGDVYSASFAAVPHVVRVLGSAPDRAGADYFHFPAWVEICRVRTNEPIPPDLQNDYMSALAQLPALAGAAADRPWDDTMLRATLAATAAAKESVDLAEAILEMTPELAPEFLEWSINR